MSDAVRWPDEVQQVLAGDNIAVMAYGTPAGGAVAVPIAALGAVDRAAGTFTASTGLAWHRKLRHLLRDPRVAIAFHTREHGFARDSGLVLVQGDADVPVTPDPARNAEFWERAARFQGPLPTGPLWDWALREYRDERVAIEIAIRRVTAWTGTDGSGTRAVSGEPWPEQPPAQRPPTGGTGPRLDHRRLENRLRALPHRLLAYRGIDGFPVVVPVRVTSAGVDGLRLEAAGGLLPPGGRRAGFTAHFFGPGAIGLGTQVCTGWLDVAEDGSALYAGHTASGFSVPGIKAVQLFGNGMLAKQGIRKARRDGTLAELARLKNG